MAFKSENEAVAGGENEAVYSGENEAVYSGEKEAAESGQTEQIPLVNILTRTSGRPKFFAENVESVRRQNYPRIRHLISYDDDESGEYVHNVLNIDFDQEEKIEFSEEAFRVDRIENKGNGHFPYNLYLNRLQAEVESGWIMFLDDDDVFVQDDALSQIMSAILLRESRSRARSSAADYLVLWQVGFPGGRVVPKRLGSGFSVRLGDISCIGFMYHSRHVNAGTWGDQKGGDYRVIKELYDYFEGNVCLIPEVLTAVNYQENRRCGSGQRNDLGDFNRGFPKLAKKPKFGTGKAPDGKKLSEVDSRKLRVVNKKKISETRKESNMEDGRKKNNDLEQMAKRYLQTYQSDSPVPVKKVTAPKLTPKQVQFSEDAPTVVNYTPVLINEPVANNNSSEKEDVDQLDISDSEEMNENEATEGSENEANEVDENEAIEGDENEANEVDENEAIEGGENESDQEDEHEIAEDIGNAEGSDNEAMYSDENDEVEHETNEVDEHETDEVDENDEVDEHETDEHETNEVDEHETNEVDENAGGENETDDGNGIAVNDNKDKPPASATNFSLVNQSIVGEIRQQLQTDMAHFYQHLEEQHETWLKQIRSEIQALKEELQSKPPKTIEKHESTSTKVGLVSAKAQLAALRGESVKDAPSQNVNAKLITLLKGYETRSTNKSGENEATKGGENEATKSGEKDTRSTGEKEATGSGKEATEGGKNEATKGGENEAAFGVLNERVERNPDLTNSRKKKASLATPNETKSKNISSVPDTAQAAVVSEINVRHEAGASKFPKMFSQMFTQVYIINLTEQGSQLQQQLADLGLSSKVIKIKSPKNGSTVFDFLPEIARQAQKKSLPSVLVLMDSIKMHVDILREMAYQWNDLSEVDWKILLVGANHNLIRNNKFDWQYYLSDSAYRSELEKHNINTEQLATRHWKFYGQKEGRFGARTLDHWHMLKNICGVAIRQDVYDDIGRMRKTSQLMVSMNKSLKQKTYAVSPLWFLNDLKTAKARNRHNLHLYN